MVFVCPTNLMEMEYIKLEVFRVEGRALIMAKEHPALQELFKTLAGEQQSPLLCLALIKDSQRFHFYLQTCSLTRHSRLWLASTTLSSVST